MVDGIDDLTSCALSRVLVATLGGKWKPYIIWYLSLQPHQRARYGELKKIIPYKISDKMFSQHLNELEETGMLERIVVEDKPLWVDYLLTPDGASMANLLYLIRDWDVVHRNFSVEALKRTKGLLNDGKLEYGTVGEDGKIEKRASTLSGTSTSRMTRTRPRNNSSVGGDGSPLAGTAQLAYGQDAALA